jgi:hypothetical protein
MWEIIGFALVKANVTTEWLQIGLHLKGLNQTFQPPFSTRFTRFYNEQLFNI